MLEQGVLEGRRVFGNIVKYIKMAASSNFGNMFSVVGASAFLPFLPMLPTQILLNNFLYDIAQVTIPSDNVEFNKTPAMKAREITAATIELLRSGRFRWGRINFPNGDMVGHTGVFDATTEAMEAVDESMARLEAVIDELGGVLIYTADHGNADVMFTEAADGTRTPVTSHTLNPVPFAIHDPGWHGDYRLSPPPDAGLATIAATLCNLLGYEAPDGYEPSLLSFTD